MRELQIYDYIILYVKHKFYNFAMQVGYKFQL